MKKQDRYSSLRDLPLVSHLVEMRDRLLKVLLAILVIFLMLMPFANDIYVFVASPLMAQLPVGTSMIATDVASPFFTPFKLALVLSIFLSMPLILYQVWGFIAPGLYKHERRLVLPLLASSSLLFYLGAVFAYYVVFPLVFGFFTSTAPDGVAVMTDISKYLDFVLKMFFAFGLSFEVPIVIVVLVWSGISTPESLAEKRPYMIIGAFVIAMLLTPPDIISQTLLAVPMLILFEVGLACSRRIKPKSNDDDLVDGDDTSDAQQGADPSAMDEEFKAAEQEEIKLDKDGNFKQDG